MESEQKHKPVKFIFPGEEKYVQTSINQQIGLKYFYVKP